jgi:hypothetical protein
MTGRLFSVLILVQLITRTSFAQGDISISGRDKQYAGHTLEFYVYTERIFDTRHVLATTTADADGVFTVSFPLDKTRPVYCQTPLYTAILYAEPGSSYHIGLPPLPGQNDETGSNPFHIPPLWQTVPDGETSGLNKSIRDFDALFDPFLDRQILRYYNSGLSKEKLDSFTVANTPFLSSDNEYLRSYCEYKMAILGFTTSRFSQKDLYEKYLKDRPALVNLPPWWEFFNLYYDRYFSSLANRSGFSQVYSLAGNDDYSGLTSLLKNDPALQQDNIREWVILKELHNAFYENGLPLAVLNSLCDSISVGSHDNLTKSLAATMKKEAASLLSGNIPPEAKVYSKGNDTLDLSLLRGKYFYFGFCSLDNLESLQEFEYLKYFSSKYGKYLDIFILLPEAERDRSEAFAYENSIPWKFWFYPAAGSIIKDYKVRNFPVFYLLDRDGKLIGSPATLPSAGFEQQLFAILKSRKEI